MRIETPDRRAFLKMAAALSAGLLPPWLTGCGGSSAAAPTPTAAVANPSAATLSSGLPASDAIAHLLRRTRFCTTQQDYDAALAQGAAAYLDDQLRVPSPLELEYLEAATLFPITALPPPLNVAVGVVREEATRQLAAKTVFLAAYSRFQLFEVLVDFWTNHFNVENVTGDLPLHKLYDDARVIRAHALGRFADLLMASAKSPAMMEYLDTVNNVASGPNENYARELMELHTLGVDGGYTENDVREVARCFTGWGINGLTRTFEFNAANHDDGEKQVLGHVIPAGGGVGDGERVLAILAAHPSTARFVATKLCRRFVADVPAETLVARVAATFTQSGGDIPSVLRSLFADDEFYAAQDMKFRRPLEYVSAILGALYRDALRYDADRILSTLSRMGQIPHRWFPPDGYPDRTDYWLSTSGLLERWNFAAESVEQLGLLGRSVMATYVGDEPDVASLVQTLARALLQRPLRDGDVTVLVAAVGPSPTPLTDEARIEKATLIAGLLLASPYFTLR